MIKERKRTGRRLTVWRKWIKHARIIRKKGRTTERETRKWQDLPAASKLIIATSLLFITVKNILNTKEIDGENPPCKK